MFDINVWGVVNMYQDTHRYPSSSRQRHQIIDNPRLVYECKLVITSQTSHLHIQNATYHQLRNPFAGHTFNSKEH